VRRRRRARTARIRSITVIAVVLALSVEVHEDDLREIAHRGYRTPPRKFSPPSCPCSPELPRTWTSVPSSDRP
jgi:hypothetical protein